jgi:hypothetical protein
MAETQKEKMSCVRCHAGRASPLHPFSPGLPEWFEVEFTRVVYTDEFCDEQEYEGNFNERSFTVLKCVNCGLRVVRFEEWDKTCGTYQEANDGESCDFIPHPVYRHYVWLPDGNSMLQFHLTIDNKDVHLAAALPVADLVAAAPVATAPTATAPVAAALVAAAPHVVATPISTANHFQPSVSEGHQRAFIDAWKDLKLYAEQHYGSSDHWTESRINALNRWILEVDECLKSGHSHVIGAGLGAIIEIACETEQKKSDNGREYSQPKFPYNKAEIKNWSAIRKWRNHILHDGSNSLPSTEVLVASVTELMKGLAKVVQPPPSKKLKTASK